MFLAILSAVPASGMQRRTAKGSIPNKLISPDGDISGELGTSVAIDMDTIVVGAPRTRLSSGLHGAAYVFSRINGQWLFEAKLEPTPETLEVAQFGASVAVSGDTIVVGAPGESIGGQSTDGAVYLFVRRSFRWTLVKKFVNPEGTNVFKFGVSVALENNTFVGTTMASASSPGAGYVFTRSDVDWALTAKLTDPSARQPDQFGFSCALDVDTIVIGSAFGDTNRSPSAGAASVFVKDASGWRFQARLAASDGGSGDRFGNGVAIEGDTIIVGASVARTSLTYIGAAYVFTRVGENWTERQKLATVPLPDGDNTFGFGSQVGISGDRILIGAYLSDVGGKSDQGAAFLFKNDGNTWSPRARLAASDGVAADKLGTSVAIDGNKMVAGAPGVDLAGTNSQGAAYVFVEPTAAPDLQPASDSGPSNTDNNTNSQTLVFDIQSITPGATVEFLRDGAVIESKVVQGSSTTFTDAPTADAITRYSTRQVVNGETSSPSEDTTVYLDRTPPGVAIEQASYQSDPTTQSRVSFRVTFSELVLGLDLSDLNFDGSTADLSHATATLSNSPESNTILLEGIVSNGQIVRAQVRSGAVIDFAGNPSGAPVARDSAVTVDNVVPTVTINQAAGQPDPTTVTPLKYTVQFSEPVTDFAPDDLTVSPFNVAPGAVFAVTGSGTNYDVTLSGISSDGSAVVVSVRSGAAADAFGNPNNISTSLDNTIKLDNVAPKVTVNQSAFQADPTAKQPISFVLNFSENVTGLDASDISLAGSTANTSAARITITGSGFSYLVTVDTIISSGQVRVSVPAGLVADSLGNANQVSSGGDNAVTLNVPTSAMLSGRVVDATGRGVFRALLILTLPDGTVRYTQTNPFGYYKFIAAPTGDVVLTVSQKSGSSVSNRFYLLQDVLNFNLAIP